MDYQKKSECVVVVAFSFSFGSPPPPSSSSPYHSYQFRGLNVAPQLVFNSGKTVSYSSQTDSLLITVAKEYDSDNNQTTVTFPKLSLNSETFKWQMNEGKFLTTNHTEITTAVNKYGNVSPTLDIICFTEVRLLKREKKYDDRPNATKQFFFISSLFSSTIFQSGLGYPGRRI